eukprot:747673-Hanusia_phi.AAC.8
MDSSRSNRIHKPTLREALSQAVGGGKASWEPFRPQRSREEHSSMMDYVNSALFEVGSSASSRSLPRPRPCPPSSVTLHHSYPHAVRPTTESSSTLVSSDTLLCSGWSLDTGR